MDEKKNKYNKKKALMIAILVALPTAMLFGFLLTNTRAYDYYIPEKSTNNKWHWSLDDLTLNYSLDMKVIPFGSQEIVSRFKMTYITQIVDIGNHSGDLMGPQEEVSTIYGINLFENISTGSLEPYGDYYSLGTFVYNETVEPHLRYMYGQGWIMPMILPVNGTATFDEDIMGDVLNDTYYYASLRGEMNYFDSLSTNTGGTENNIYFEDTEMVGCYLNMTYYDDGILEKGDAKHLFYFEEDGWMILEYKIQNVGADINVTDEVEWGVDVGDVLYMGRSTEYDEDERSFVEVKIVIEKFNLSNYGIPTIFGEDPIPTTFENVIADLYMWNWTTEEYILEMNDQPLGAANNDYPSPYFGEDALEIAIGIIPNNTMLDDLIFMGEVYQPLDVEYSANNDWEFNIWSSEMDFSLYQNYNNKTGVLELRTLRVEGDLRDVMYRKGAENFSSPFPVIFTQLYDDLVDTQVWLNAFVTDSVDVELYSAVLPVNPLEPIGVKFNDEIPDFTIYIEAYTNASLEIFHPNFTVTYDPTVLNELEIPEDKLVVYYFKNDTSEYAPLDLGTNYSIYETINTITINVTELGIFAIGTPEVWNWSEDIKIGEKLIYESTGTLMGNVTELGIVTLPYIDFSILNITAVGLGKKDKIYNQINGTILYYDPEIKALRTWEDPGTFTISEYNYSSPYFTFNLSIYTLGFPLVIPLRWDQLALQTVGLELNRSFYSASMAREMGLPIWDEIYANYVDRTLVFNDTITNYYMKLQYYNNGTLEGAEIAVKFNIEEQPVDFNLTTTRMFDYNHTDEVEWGVEVGEEYYFGGNFPSGGPTIEIKATIVAINQSAVYLRELFFGEDGGDGGGFPIFQTILTFENVWAKIEWWNITSDEGSQTGEWLSIEPNSTIIIGEANNYFPFIFGDYNGYYDIEAQTIPLLLPLGIDGYELSNKFSDFLGLLSLMIFEGEIVPEIENVREDYLRIDFDVPYEPDYDFYMEMYLNNETGIMRYFYMYEEFGDDSYIACIFSKNHSSDQSGSTPKSYVFNNYLVPEISGILTISATTSSEYYHIFEAILNKNPVNNSIPSSWGTPMFYLDFFYINNSNNPWNMTISLKLPSKYYVGYVTSIAIYTFDYENPEVGVWKLQSIDDIPFGYVTRDYQNNILTIHMINVNGTISAVEACFYSPPAGYIPPSGGDDNDGGEAAPQAIPGFDLWVILGIVAIISLVTIFKRKKLIELA